MPSISTGFLWLLCWEEAVGGTAGSRETIEEVLGHNPEEMVAWTRVLQCEQCEADRLDIL